MSGRSRISVRVAVGGMLGGAFGCLLAWLLGEAGTLTAPDRLPSLAGEFLGLAGALAGVLVVSLSMRSSDV